MSFVRSTCRSRHSEFQSQGIKRTDRPTDRPTDWLPRPSIFALSISTYRNAVAKFFRSTRLTTFSFVFLSARNMPPDFILVLILEKKFITCTIYSNIYNTRMKLGPLRYVNVETFRYKFSHRENEENCLKPFFSFTHQSVSQSLTRWRAHDRIFLPGKSRRIGRVFPGISAYHVFRDKSSPLFERIVTTDFLNFHRKFFQRHFNAKKIFTLIWYWQ